LVLTPSRLSVEQRPFHREAGGEDRPLAEERQTDEEGK
jgi:hypothetical protein